MSQGTDFLPANRRRAMRRNGRSGSRLGLLSIVCFVLGILFYFSGEVYFQSLFTDAVSSYQGAIEANDSLMFVLLIYFIGFLAFTIGVVVGLAGITQKSASPKMAWVGLLLNGGGVILYCVIYVSRQSLL